MNLSGRSLELFFIDGRPDGMLTAEVFNWTGHVLRIPRTQLKEGLGRPEAKFTGVYILVGEQDGTPMAYVGEAEDMASRLRDHAAKKDWWDTAVLITTSANSLHKAHVKFLESRLVEIAIEVNAMALENGNQPTRSSLSESQTANMESYLDTLMMVLPAIRLDNFLRKRRSEQKVVTPQSQNSPVDKNEVETIFEMRNMAGDINAKAVLRDGEMVVKAGSRVRSTWVGEFSEKTHYWKFHEALVGNATIVDGVFTTDYAFTSPSGAASVVAGRSASGRREWKVVGTNQTYADWENAQLTEVAE